MGKIVYFIFGIVIFFSCSNRNEEFRKFNLLSPPGATTENYVMLYWESEIIPDEKSVFSITMDGEEIGTTPKNTYRVENLAPGSLYKFHVSLVNKQGGIAGKSNVVEVWTKPEGEVFNITDFGAVGDGETLDTKAIQEAIDSCSQYGSVVIPKGIYRTGALFVKSNMTLYFEEDAILKGSLNSLDYPVVMSRHEGRVGKQYASIINGGELYGKGIQNFSIRGKGTIIGEGETLFKLEKQYSDTIRGRIVCLKNGENIFIEGMSFQESPCRGVHLLYCDGITLDNVYINTRFDPKTGRDYKLTHADGLTFDSSKNGFVLNSTFSSQDDAITMKSGRDAEGRKVGKSTGRIRIVQNTFTGGQGVVVGSEMSGSIRDVLVSNCRFENTVYMVQIKAPWGRGGIVENIKYKNLTFSDTLHDDNLWHRGAICIDQYYGVENPDFSIRQTIDENMPIVRNIWFENIAISRENGYGIYICGRPELYLKNITFKDINARSHKGFYGYFVDQLQLNNVEVNSRSGENFCLENVIVTDND